MVWTLRITASLGVLLACATPLAKAQPPGVTTAKIEVDRGGGGNVNISPKRVVFSEKDRGSTVVLFNQGAAPTTYAIDLADHYMDADGSVREPSDGKPLPPRRPLGQGDGQLRAAPGHPGPRREPDRQAARPAPRRADRRRVPHASHRNLPAAGETRA
jgi:hypothetical protein